MTTTRDKEMEKDVTFAETALRLGGKTEEEATRTGAVDRADEQVESLFAPQYKTANSPVHKAVWDNQFDLELFSPLSLDRTAPCRKAMEQSLAVVRQHQENRTMYDDKGKIATRVVEDLAQAGYWGMLIDKQYGGQGATVSEFMSFLGQVATVEPTVAGLASVHGCIGAVDPVRSFGNEEQKQRLLPKLASGERLSGFALTEPGAGSDLTALRTTAVLKGDQYLITGEKLFITNAIPGRMVTIVCLIDGKPAALVADLPPTETEQFRIAPYGLYALSRTYNNGLIFKDFAVPKDNLLKPPVGDGLTVAYHGLNLGRLALCTNAAGAMKSLLANMLPWAHFRETYGAAIETRELVKRRIARMAALIVGADSLVAWGSGLLDRGYRGELECIIAKIFGSEAQKEAAIELFMKTHGGRSFLHGHLFGDNVHDFLAPCIYEGEGEMLGMAFFKALAKQHGVQFFEPVGKALQRAGLRAMNPANPAHVWALRHELVPYSIWWLKKNIESPQKLEVPRLHPRLAGHLDFAVECLSSSALELSNAMVKHQLKLADRQLRMADMSQRVQDAITILVTTMWAHHQKDDVKTAAADILCQDLQRKLTGERPSDGYFKACTKLADMIIEGQYADIAEIPRRQIKAAYAKN